MIIQPIFNVNTLDGPYNSICFSMTCTSQFYFTIKMLSNTVYWPVKHLNYNDALYESTVSLIHLCACYSACRVIKLWRNNGKAQGELKKPPTPKPNETYRHRILHSFSSLQRKLALFWLTCLLVCPRQQPTHTPLIDAWVSPVFLSVSSLSVLPWRKSAPSCHCRCFSISVAPASKTHSNLVPSPQIPEQLPCSDHLHPLAHCMAPTCHWATALKEKNLSWLWICNGKE